MLYPFIQLITTVIDLYIFAIILWSILSLLIYFKIVNGYQPFVRQVMITLNRLILPVLNPIHKIIPDLGGIDISPLLIILLLNFVKSALIHWLVF
jgi:YggT family protein